MTAEFNAPLGWLGQFLNVFRGDLLRCLSGLKACGTDNGTLV